MHFAALTFFGVDGFLDDPLAGPHPGALDALGASDSGIQTDLANMFPNSAIVIEFLANSPILFLVLFLVFLIFVSSFLSRTKTGQTFLHKQALSLEVRRIQPRSNTRGIFTVSSGPCSCTGAGCTWARTLVERFDIELFSDFSAKLANFIRLVLFCIDAKFVRKYSLESS